jgi:hypothetical protein
MSSSESSVLTDVQSPNLKDQTLQGESTTVRGTKFSSQLWLMRVLNADTPGKFKSCKPEEKKLLIAVEKQSTPHPVVGVSKKARFKTARTSGRIASVARAHNYVKSKPLTERVLSSTAEIGVDAVTAFGCPSPLPRYFDGLVLVPWKSDPEKVRVAEDTERFLANIHLKLGDKYKAERVYHYLKYVAKDLEAAALVLAPRKTKLQIIQNPDEPEYDTKFAYAVITDRPGSKEPVILHGNRCGDARSAATVMRHLKALVRLSDKGRLLPAQRAEFYSDLAYVKSLLSRKTLKPEEQLWKSTKDGGPLTRRSSPLFGGFTNKALCSETPSSGLRTSPQGHITEDSARLADEA